MSKKEKLEIGAISKPRFEFRTFGRSFEDAAYLMSRLSTPVPEKVWERTSEEIYIKNYIRLWVMVVKTFQVRNYGTVPSMNITVSEQLLITVVCIISELPVITV